MELAGQKCCNRASGRAKRVKRFTFKLIVSRCTFTRTLASTHEAEKERCTKGFNQIDVRVFLSAFIVVRLVQVHIPGHCRIGSKRCTDTQKLIERGCSVLCSWLYGLVEGCAVPQLHTLSFQLRPTKLSAQKVWRSHTVIADAKITNEREDRIEGPRRANIHHTICDMHLKSFAPVRGPSTRFRIASIASKSSRTRRTASG